VLRKAQNVFEIIAVNATETPYQQPEKSSAQGAAARKGTTP